MSRLVWAASIAWIAVAVVVAGVLGARGLREGRSAAARARLASPTLYLFTAYLFVAALVTPRSPGESSSPLYGLAIVLPLGYAAATFAALGVPRPSVAVAIALGLLEGGAVLAASAILLALMSPAFVPPWLR